MARRIPDGVGVTERRYSPQTIRDVRHITPTMRAWMSASDAVDLCARDSVTVDPVHRQVWSPRTSGPGPFNAARIWLSPSIRQ
jgi:hypothetical protein